MQTIKKITPVKFHTKLFSGINFVDTVEHLQEVSHTSFYSSVVRNTYLWIKKNPQI